MTKNSPMATRISTMASDTSRGARNRLLSFELDEPGTPVGSSMLRRVLVEPVVADAVVVMVVVAAVVDEGEDEEENDDDDVDAVEVAVDDGEVVDAAVEVAVEGVVEEEDGRAVVVGVVVVGVVVDDVGDEAGVLLVVKEVTTVTVWAVN
jgi:hypothetical protein